jgi:hypothetical protein
MDSKFLSKFYHCPFIIVNDIKDAHHFHNLGMLKVAGCMQKSTAVMSIMSSLLRVPEMQETMAQLSKEMTKVLIEIHIKSYITINNTAPHRSIIPFMR